MTENAHILISGRDPVLLRTRGKVLESAGYRVATTLHPIQLSADLEAQLLIVCHTLSVEERLNDLSAMAKAVPGAKVLCLTPHAGAETEGSASFDSFSGPREMLRVVERLLTT